MATTPEQRNRHAMCGAKKRNGESCRAYAGQGTDHPGTGACKFHGGATPNHGKAALKVDLKQRMIAEGHLDEPVSAMNSLIAELNASSAYVAWLRMELADLPKDELGSLYGQALTRLFDQERDRRVKIARLAIESGVDEAAIRVKEVQVALLGEALKRATDALGYTEEQRQELGAELRRQLMSAEQTRPALAP